MTTVRPEHIKQAGYLFGMAINANIDEQPDWLMGIAQLLADLDTARADARVLDHEVRMWRENDGCSEANAGKAIHRTLHLEPAMDATDASGALERNRSQP